MSDLVLDGALLVLLLLCTAFFSAAEVAFLSVSNVKLHSLVEKNVPGAERLHRLRHNRRRVIIALLIGSSLVNVAISALGTTVAIDLFGDAGLGIAVGAMFFLILTFGEIAPKSAATTYGERMALLLSPYIELFYTISFPLVLLFEFINHLIPGVYSKATGIERFTEEEVRSAVRMGVEYKSITEKERELIENVLALNDKSISQVMVTKAGVISLRADSLVREAHKKAVDYGYARFPVIGKNGEVVGVASMRTLGIAMHNDPNGRISEYVRPPVKLPSARSVSEAFQELQKLGRNMAIVVDGEGRFVGIVTMEDLLSEIVGDYE